MRFKSDAETQRRLNHARLILWALPAVFVVGGLTYVLVK